MCSGKEDKYQAMYVIHPEYFILERLEIDDVLPLLCAFNTEAVLLIHHRIIVIKSKVEQFLPTRS